jgi:proton glutamate symport protein
MNLFLIFITPGTIPNDLNLDEGERSAVPHTILKKSLGIQVLIAIFSAIFVGLFFGPYCSVLRPVGDVFAMLLQMVVLPYITFSLIHGLGSLTPDIAKRLLKRGWPFFILLWAIAYFVVHMIGSLMPQPILHLIGFTSDQQKGIGEQILSFLVPANPIYDFANNILPAVTFFGIIVGAALLHIEKKEPLLGVLERTNRVIEKIFEWIAMIAPIGIFAHIAVAVGTVDFLDLYKLQFYVFALIVACLFLTFWTLPALISSLTPMSYREILGHFRAVCLLAFATTLPSIAFPFILKSVRRLAEKYHLKGSEFHSTSQTVVPIGFTFAQIGNAMLLFFMMFVSFYYRHPFTWSENALLNALVVPMSFGSSLVSLNAVSFLIDYLYLPPKVFTLFVDTLAVTLNFQVLLSVASIFTFVILVFFAFGGKLRLNMRKLCLNFGLSLVVFSALVLAIKHSIKLEDRYSNLYQNLSISEALQMPANAAVEESLDAGLTESQREERKKLTPLARILKEGKIRVGYELHNIPFCYANANGKVVGYDIAFAYQLAKDLDCKLELVPLNIDTLSDEINSGSIDIGMSAILMNEERILSMDFTQSYLEQSNVLVVPSSKKERFLKAKPSDHAFTHGNFVIGGAGGYFRAAERHFPFAQVKQVESIDALIKGEIDGLLWSRIPAFVWCLSHPQYVILGYNLTLGKQFFSYPVEKGADNFLTFLNHWLDLKRQSGFTDQQYRYWVYGESPLPPEPRWSILRNVLHVGK